MISVRGQGARSVRQSLFSHDGCAGSVPVLREHAEVQLPLVASYRTMQAPSGAMGPELRFRASQAHGAFQEGRRKLYKSRSICVKRKAHLLNATVFAKLLQGAGAWPPLGKQKQKNLRYCCLDPGHTVHPSRRQPEPHWCCKLRPDRLASARYAPSPGADDLPTSTGRGRSP